MTTRKLFVCDGNYMANHKLPKPLIPDDVKVRRCLRCNNEFQSMGPHNRICPGCEPKNIGSSRRHRNETNCGRRLVRSVPH